MKDEGNSRIIQIILLSTLISLRNTKDGGPKLSKNRSSVDWGSLRYYISTNTIVEFQPRNSSVAHDGNSQYFLKKVPQKKKIFNVSCVLSWKSFKMESFAIGIELFVFWFLSLTWQLCFFGFPWVDTEAFCLFSLHSSTYIHTHTVHCSKLTQKQCFLKVL